MIQMVPLMAGLVGLSGFQALLVASQFALVLSVLVLLLMCSSVTALQLTQAHA